MFTIDFRPIIAKPLLLHKAHPLHHEFNNRENVTRYGVLLSFFFSLVGMQTAVLKNPFCGVGQWTLGDEFMEPKGQKKFGKYGYK
jgi:hypothetical protein